VPFILDTKIFAAEDVRAVCFITDVAGASQIQEAKE